MRLLLPAASEWFPSVISFGGMCRAVGTAILSCGKSGVAAAASAAAPRVEGVARPVAQEAERDHDGRDDRRRREEEEEVALGVLDRAVEHVAQRRGGVL